MLRIEQRADQPEHAANGYETAAAELDTFLANRGLDEAVELYGITIDGADPALRLVTLEAIAARKWDYRKGKERAAAAGDPEVDVEGTDKWHRVFAAANQLGMVESSKPHNKTPDYLVVLGGSNRSAIDRMDYALDSVDDFGHMVFLASGRVIVSKDEQAKVSDFAPKVDPDKELTEFDVTCRALEYNLGARLSQEFTQYREGSKYVTRMYEFEHNGQIKQAYVLSTPEQVNGHRATTYDNYRFFAEQFRLDTLGAVPQAELPTVVAVTTGFYVPGQHLPAVQELTLPYGIQVETIGHSADYSKVKRKPSQLLQEMKSAIDAAKRLYLKLNELAAARS